MPQPHPASNEDVEADKAVAEFISRRRKPGFPCPRCEEPIVVGIPALLARSDVRCDKCGLQLHMDWRPDAKARRALENVLTAAAEVEKARKFRS
jgi:transcription elongation factor Elf1